MWLTKVLLVQPPSTTNVDQGATVVRFRSTSTSVNVEVRRSSSKSVTLGPRVAPYQGSMTGRAFAVGCSRYTILATVAGKESSCALDLRPCAPPLRRAPFREAVREAVRERASERAWWTDGLLTCARSLPRGGWLAHTNKHSVCNV